MKYDIDDIVTLDDDKEYYLIDKNIVDGNVYYYACEYTGDIESMSDNEKLFFKDEDGYLVDVTDLDIIMKLKELFLNKFVGSI